MLRQGMKANWHGNKGSLGQDLWLGKEEPKARQRAVAGRGEAGRIGGKVANVRWFQPALEQLSHAVRS